MVHVERVHRLSGEVTVDVREHEVDLVVKARREVAERIILLEFSAADGAALPIWSAGSHIDLLLGNDFVRQYSLCGDPTDRMTWKTAVLLESESRGGSSYIHAHLVPGASVRARGPRNHFELRASPRYVFIAGGIGITPILPMIMTAEASGAAWTLAYAGRRRTSMAFLDDLLRYGDPVTIYSSEEDQRIDLTALLGRAAADTLIYCCGPERLLSGVEVEAAHWAPGAIHVERFVPKSVGAPVWNGEFEIELRQSGKILTVRPMSRS